MKIPTKNRPPNTKKPTFFIFWRARSVVCFYGVRDKGMLQIKLWTLGLIKKIYKQTIALFIKLFRFNWPYILINAFLTQIPTFVQKTDHLPTKCVYVQPTF